MAEFGNVRIEFDEESKELIRQTGALTRQRPGWPVICALWAVIVLLATLSFVLSADLTEVEYKVKALERKVEALIQTKR